MRKYVEIPLEVMERLVEGKCVEGSLRRDWSPHCRCGDASRVEHRHGDAGDRRDLG